MDPYLNRMCSMRPDEMGGCPTGYRLFKMKGGTPPCCKRVSRQAPCPKTKKDKKKSRRFISPISGRCVTRAGQILAQSKLDKMQNISAQMSGEEPLGDYASEAGITFFGRKRRSKKSIKRYNVSGSPCNRIKKKACKAKSGCNYVKRRGCRRAKGFAKNIIAGAVPVVNEQVAEAGIAAAAAAVEAGAPVAEQAIAAAAAAGDAAAANVEAAGGTPEQAHEAAVAAAEPAAQQVIEAAGIPPEEAVAIVNNAVETIEVAPIGGTESMASQVAAMARARAARLGQVEFGRRKSRFGSYCSTLLPKDINTCLNYNVGGMYPCNWSGGANSRCQARSGGPVPFSIASTAGKYMTYVIGVTSGLASMVPPPPVMPVAAMIPTEERGEYVCVGKNMSECGSNPNCNWQAGAKPPRCVRRTGHEGGQQYEGPMGPSSGYTPPEEDLDALDFGRRRSRFGNPFAKMVANKIKAKATEAANKLKEKAIEVAKKAKVEALKQLELATAFGKKKKRPVYSKKIRKPPTALLKKCRKYGIKTTIKRGSKRVYKSAAVLKKLISSFGDYKRVPEFGKKRRKACKGTKLPAKILKLCKKFKIKTTKKVGGKKVCKKLSVIKKMIAKKIRKLHKKMKKLHHRR